MKTRILLIAVTAMAALLTGCGGGNSSSSPTPGNLTGSLIDSPVAGVTYITSGGYAGTTDANGLFSYNAGETITFKIGSLALGTVAAAAVITPIELGNANPDPILASNIQNNLLVLLQSLDSGASSSALTVTAAAAAEITAALNLTAAPAAFATSLASMSITPVPLATAQANFQAQRQPSFGTTDPVDFAAFLNTTLGGPRNVTVNWTQPVGIAVIEVAIGYSWNCPGVGGSIGSLTGIGYMIATPAPGATTATVPWQSNAGGFCGFSDTPISATPISAIISLVYQVNGTGSSQAISKPYTAGKSSRPSFGTMNPVNFSAFLRNMSNGITVNWNQPAGVEVGSVWIWYFDGSNFPCIVVTTPAPGATTATALPWYSAASTNPNAGNSTDCSGMTPTSATITLQYQIDGGGPFLEESMQY